jgi:alcohol dehydrogenase class IV
MARRRRSDDGRTAIEREVHERLSRNDLAANRRVLKSFYSARIDVRGYKNKKMKFEFATAGRIIFGAGTFHDVGSLAKENGKRALVVMGKNSKRAEPLLELLSEKSLDTVTFSVAGEPEISTVQNGVALAKREQCDFVISFGGGSAIDTGKAIAAMMTNDGELLDYLEIIGHGKPFTKIPAPFIAIPTTAGTGAEVTRNSVLASPGHRVKVSLRSPLMLPKIAIVDPELTHDLPPALTASTGLDALTQLIEPFVCSRANPMTDNLCIDGMNRCARSLRKCFEIGRDANAREDMALASLFGGIALANAGLGAVHGFAGPIGGMFSAPHGAICAALLAHVMETNLRALKQRQPESKTILRYRGIARIVTGKPTAAAESGVEWVRGLVSDLQIPRLGAYGINPSHIPELLEKAKNASSMKANPIALTSEELAGILERAI